MVLLVGTVVALLAFLTIAVYTLLGIRVAKTGGKVPVQKFGLPDVILSSLLIFYLIALAIAGFSMPEKQIRDSDILKSGIVEVIIVAALCGFLALRGFKLASQFGLGALRPDKVAGIAVLLLFAFYPLLVCTSIVTQKILGPEAKPQELIKMFSEASEQMNYRTLVYTLVTGVLVAPVAEEMIFRGYLYPILKRYLGILPGILLNAALFSVVHLNVAALPALFLFAVCLTLAYEYTGSILVNICMHGLFNFCALTLVFFFSKLTQ